MFSACTAIVLPVGGTPKKPAMRPTHRESRSDDIAFDDGFLKSPLNVGESAAHHPDDLQVALWPVHGFGAPRNLKHGVRRNQLCGEPRVRCVDELHEASHELSVCGLHLSPRNVYQDGTRGLVAARCPRTHIVRVAGVFDTIKVGC